MVQLYDISNVNHTYDDTKLQKDGDSDIMSQLVRDNFGHSVSLDYSGNRLGVGAPNILLLTNNVGLINVDNKPYRFGAVYIYDISYIIPVYHRRNIENQLLLTETNDNLVSVLTSQILYYII